VAHRPGLRDHVARKAHPPSLVAESTPLVAQVGGSPCGTVANGLHGGGVWPIQHVPAEPRQLPSVPEIQQVVLRHAAIIPDPRRHAASECALRVALHARCARPAARGGSAAAAFRPR
jgi:hypothetical protein